MNNFHMREGKVEFRWKRWRNKKRQEVSSCLMVLFSGAVLLGAGGVAVAGPTGGQVTGGQGTITNPNGTTTNINQQSNVLNINWQDFSIGAGETVNFYQPGSTSIAINRVVGGVPSYLAGALNANGRVFILNSAGITFTGTSQVNVGALLATTAMTVNGDPTQAASYSGTGYGAVINQGSISVSNGGFAILAAPYVQNTGFIKADLGTIALAGTNQFTLDLSGTGLINFVVPAGAVEQIVSDGKAVGVDNSGTLQARSGQVVISANVASEVINAVVNLNGIVDADAFAPNGQGGAVLVSAAGDVNVGGQVTARGNGSGAGGQIVTKAGGADLIGQMAYVSARGGASGVGGHIEVSGKTVGLNGSIDPGKGGLLYVDPATFIIRNGTSGQTGSGIGEHKLEALLQNGAGFSVDVAGNITIQDLTDNVLAGGSGDLTLHAGTGGAGNIIVQGVNDIIRTGSGDVTLTAAGNIGDAGHRLSFVSGTGLPGVSQAGDILLSATNGGSIFVKNVTVKSAGNSAFHALFSANAANSFNAAGLIDVEARASGAGQQKADAEIHINAGNHIALHGITERATANEGFGGGGSVFANAIVTLNGTQVQDTGAMTLVANVAGHSGFSFVADADLEITGAGVVGVTGGAVNVTARANVFSASNVIADATVFIDPITLGPIALDSVFVNANVQADKVANALARASFEATGSQISIANDAVVNARANNQNLGRTASATANLFLTATIGKASVHGNVGVTALALNGGGSQDADASANLDINAHGGIVVDGNVTVIANAQTLRLSTGDSSTPNACAIASFHANSGGIHIHGGLDVEAVDSSLNSDSVIARARARLVTSNNGHSIDSAVLGTGSIEVDGPTKVLATAKTNAQNEFRSSGAVASASLLVHGEGHVHMDAVTVKASASDIGRFQANAIAHANIISQNSGISISGDIDVEANAQDPVGSYASANAEANIQASGDIDILGNVQVNAIAQQNNGGTSTGGAFARANLHIVASSHSEGVADVNVNGNIGVHALAETNGSGSATANAEVLLSAGGGSGGDVTVNGSIGVTATANQLSNSGEGAQACANLDIHASSHFSSAAVINVNGDITVDAFARSNGTGNVTANAQAGIGGHGADIEDGSSSSNPGTAVNVTVNGNIDVSAAANHVGTGAGAALALANLDIDATSGSVNVNGNIGVHANAQTNGTGGTVSSFFGSSGPRFFGAAADARAEIAAEKGSSQITPSSAGDVTVNGNVEVSAIANQLNTEADGGALACAGLDMDADFSSGLINVNGDIAVNALAKDLGTGSARANAFAGIDAQGSVLVHGNVHVNATAEQLNTDGSSARARANLEMSASSGSVNVNGDVGAYANALAQGDGHASANARVNIFASSDINITGNVYGVASANQNGAGGSFARGTANVNLHPNGDINVNGGVLASANAFSKGSESAVANAVVHILTSGDVTVNGVVTANAHAVADSTNSAAPNNGALALASIDVNGDPVTLGGVDEHATATSHGSINQANALANAHLHGASDLLVHGDVTVFAKALDDSTASGKGAVANAHLVANAGELLSIDGVNVTASANYAGQSHAYDASAFASLEGSRVVVGDTIVKSRASGHGASGLSKATLLVTDSSFIHMTGSINVEADLVGSGFSPIGATALASLNGNSITVDGRTRVVAMTTGSHAGLGSVFANALLNVNATKNVHFGSSIDVEALVNGSDAHGFNAHPVVQVNASSLEVDGNLKVLANANGASANSVIAAPTLNLDNVGQVVTNGIELDAFAHGHAVKLILANAVLIDSGHANFTDHGLTKVFAKASGSSASTIQADATLQVNVPNNASFGGGIDVVASAFGITSFSSHGAKAIVANAIANIQANNLLTIGDDLTVTALASGNTATKVTAQALGRLRGVNGVDLTSGDVDVSATANGGSRVSFGTAAAVASLDILAANGGVHLGGDVNVTANVSYQPNSSDSSEGVIVGNAFALANAAIVANNGGVTVDGNVDVNATLLDKSGSLGSFFSVTSFGQPGDQFLPQTAAAILNISAHSGDVTLQNVTVTANDQLDGTQHFFQFTSSNIFAGGIAQANISAPSGSVHMGAVDVEATMNAPNVNSVGLKFGVVGALAALNVEAGSDISAGSVTVKALANVGGIQTFGIDGPAGIGDAVAIANFSAGSSVDITGDVTVEASYNGIFAQHGIVIAALNVNALGGSASIDGNVTVDGTLQLTGKFGPFGTPEGEFPSDAIVFANALIHADSSVKVAGNVDVTANVQAESVKFTAFGQAAALLTGSSVEVGGNVDVEALTNVTSANSVIADARAGLFGFFGVEVDGSVTVKATAHHGNPSFTGTESGVVISKAVLSASADDGSVNIGHGVTVTANTLEEGSEDGLAFAEASVNIFGRFGVTVGGVVTAEASLNDFARNSDVLTNSSNVGPFGLFTYSGAGGLASAQVHIQDEFSGGVSLGGLTVSANATTLNPEFDGNASAFASAEVISSHGPINIAGSVVGLAHANDQGDGGALAVTLIDLEPAASFATTTASLHIGGGVTMKALAELGTMAEGNAMAVAVLNADADSGAVRIDGNVSIKANARILSSPSTPDVLIFPFGQAAAYANANLEGASGVSVGGGIAVTAKIESKTNFDSAPVDFALGDNDSFSVEWGHATAIAKLVASSGSIGVGGQTRASASAIGRGSFEPGSVAATAQVDMEARGNIKVGGAAAQAFASGTDGSNASANANVKLHASSGSISAGPAGLTAGAVALASFGTHADALASIAADAGQSIFVRGNVISLAVAISDGSGNIAHAKTHLAAGGATSSSDGPPSNFGNIVVIGNIGAFAFADATNDEATASVEIFAHNNLLIVGNDPIASARVGPSGGTTFAFRQAHFTTHDGTNFGPGGGALADIDIRAGGFISVFPASSLTHVEKLYSLPTDDPTLNSSLGLTIIPLSVDGEDCGVLGIAGKDQAAINKALGCHHKPVNVSDLTDTGP